MSELIFLNSIPADVVTRGETADGNTRWGKTSPPSHISPFSSIEWLVTQRPELAAILEKHQISNPCRGGSVSLLEACARQGVDVQTVLGELHEQSSSRGAFEPHPPPETGVVKECFDFHAIANRAQANRDQVSQEIERLSVLMAQVASDQSPYRHELQELQSMFAGFREEWQEHTQSVGIISAGATNGSWLQSPVSLEAGSGCTFLHSQIPLWKQQNAALATAIENIDIQIDHCTPSTSICLSCRALFIGLSELKFMLNAVLADEENLQFGLEALQ